MIIVEGFNTQSRNSHRLLFNQKKAAIADATQYSLLHTIPVNNTQEPNSAPRTTDWKFRQDLADEGLRWAEDPDLPSFPVVESQRKQAAQPQPVQERPKGLASSRWAGNQGVVEEQSNQRPKGLMASRWANHSQPIADKQAHGHKFKRELSHYGLKNASLARGTSEISQALPRPSPQPTAQPTSQHTYQHTPRTAPQHVPRSVYQPPSQPYTQKSQEPNRGRRWNSNKSSRTGHKSSHQNGHKITSLHDPLRIKMDWEEFEREVKQYGLKTLKDSRWAN
ncbi:hypothetical protein O1611_g2376 [Lasiodiplodia mahajangana]|uniref:Uncharacterized protein n=1 Tax=Lasiodiplodia mahajangana TaxID=1108764 RepID=A0ACC2JVF5_9PEZI|nr:hypothetical protein O1611_g2376 [Lasiodiplodia mahajangana]